MPDYKKIAWNTIAVYALSYLILVISFFTRALYARKLTVVDYGLFFGLFGFFVLFVFMRDWGLSSASMYYARKYIIGRENSKVKTLFFISHGFTLLMSLLIIAVLYLSKAVIITLVYKNEGNIGYLFDLFMVYWALETIFKGNQTFFEVYHEQPISKFIEFLFRGLILAISVVSFYFLDSYKVPVIAYVISGVAVSLVSSVWFYFRHREIFDAPISRDRAMVRSLFTYGSMVILGGVSSVVLASEDTFLIQVMIGAENVGYYVSGISASDVIPLLLMPVTIITIPLFAELWLKGKKNELSDVISFIFNHMLMLVLPVSAFFFAFSQRIIEFIFGANYSNSAIILQLFSIFVLLKMANTFLMQLLLAMGKPKESSKITFYAVVCNFILDIILIYFLKNVGAAIATGTGFLIIFLLSLREVKKDLRINFDFANNVKIAASSAIFLAVCLVLRTITFFPVQNRQLLFLVNGGIVFSIAFAVYALCLAVLKVITKEKVMFFRNLLSFRGDGK